MLNRMGLFLLALFAIMATLSCEKLPKSALEDSGRVIMEAVPMGDALPIDIGSLIAVSNVNAYEDWVQLWFQDKEGNISMISYSIPANKFYNEYRVLHRK